MENDLQPAPLQGILANSPEPLSISTYDGSGQITHPDVVSFDKPWNGFRHWMAATPYPERDASYENPSLFVSNDGINWSVPEGVSNPVAKPPANAYLSDPDIIYRPSFGLRLYYRLVDKSHNRILFIQSKNGREWTAPVETVAVPNHHLISPAVTALKTQYVMYSVKLLDNGRDTIVERRKSKDGIRWSSPETVSVLGSRDKTIWHLDASFLPERKEFWLLFYSYPSGSLYLAVSKDGLRFRTLPVPLLTGREKPDAWDRGTYWDSGLYRSTFQVNGKGEFLLWYTGTQPKTSSHIGFIKAKMSRIVSFIR
jgi:hypothetical protein